jgi:hypothetical protein
MAMIRICNKKFATVIIIIVSLSLSIIVLCNILSSLSVVAYYINNPVDDSMIAPLQVEVEEEDNGNSNSNNNNNNDNNDDDDDDDDDGCGLIGIDNISKPKWRNYTLEESMEVEDLKQCITNTGRFGNMRIGPSVNDDFHTKLDCKIQLTLDKIRSIVKQYDNIHLIGDSILEQQFWILQCMLDTTLGKDSSPSGKPWNVHKQGQQSFSFTFYSTNIYYKKGGYNFDPEEKFFYETDFPNTVKQTTSTGSSRDAIIVNAGAHYDSTRVHLHIKAIQQIMEQSTKTNATMYYIEPTTEEWPTTNGMYFPGCNNRCTCESLTKDRLLGRGGKLTFPNLNLKYKNRLPGDYRNSTTLNIKQHLHGLLQRNSSSLESFYDEHCYPDCLPATWRVDIARRLLRNRQHVNQQDNRLRIVPAFYQLLAKETPTGKGVGKLGSNIGDCTHKTMEALIVMNEQLIRRMMII